MTPVKCAFLLLAVAAVLLPSAQACKCLNVPYSEHFGKAKSVHKVKVIKAFPPVKGVQYFDVKLEKDYKGCGKRPSVFKIKDALIGTDCESYLKVGRSYLVHLDGTAVPSYFGCKGDAPFKSLSADVIAFLLANNQCRPPHP
jgi:hypothetical protein